MIAEMSMNSLQTRHEELETQLEKELNRPLPDQSLIVDLKKQKLRIKDKIEGLSAH